MQKSGGQWVVVGGWFEKGMDGAARGWTVREEGAGGEAAEWGM
jgi:hypothetical protein